MLQHTYRSGQILEAHGRSQQKENVGKRTGYVVILAARKQICWMDGNAGVYVYVQYA